MTTQNIPWYKKALIEQKKKISEPATTSLLIMILLSLWYFTSGVNFEWQSISPVSQPSLSARYFYSAFAFVTIGSFLYYIVGFWKLLYFICIKILNDKKLYSLSKGIFWTFLILLTYFYVVPIVVDLLNSVISFFYNILIILLYISPVPISFVIILLSINYFKKPKIIKNVE